MRHARCFLIYLKKSFVLIFPLILVMACLPEKVHKANDAYDFPIRPGTDEWRALGSHDDMVEACQIPEKLLREMSTEGLIETVLNYPLFMDMLAYNDLQVGFDAVAFQFNGLNELLNRADAGSKLLMRYKTIAPEALGENWTSEQKGEYAFRLAYVEILLAQKNILSNLSKNELTNLLSEALHKYQQKMRLPETYGYLSIQSTVFLMGRVLNQIGYGPFDKVVQENEHIQEFLTKGSPIPVSNLNEITALVYEFLQSGIK